MENFYKDMQTLCGEIAQRKDKQRQYKIENQIVQDFNAKINNSLIKNLLSLRSNDVRKFILNCLKSNDQAQIILSVIMIKAYLTQPKYKLNFPFLSEIINYYMSKVKFIQNPSLSDFAAKVYGMLIKTAPSGIITKFEKNANYLIKDLTNYNSKNHEEQITIYNLLYQLMKNEKYIVFKEIRKNGSIPLFNKVLNEKNQTQDAALIFLKEFVIEVCNQQKEEQQNQFFTLFNDIVTDIIDYKSANSDDYLKGVFTLTICLFQYIDKTVFKDNYVEIVTKIQKIADDYLLTRNNFLFVLYLELIPILAKYNTKIFLVNFCDDIITKLLKKIDALKLNIRENTFICFDKVIQIYKKDEIKQVSIKVFEKVKNFLEFKANNLQFDIGIEIFNCLYTILNKISWIENLDERSLNSFVNNLLIYSLDHQTIKIINFLINASDQNFAFIVKLKLWTILGTILNIPEKLNLAESINQNNEQQLQLSQTQNQENLHKIIEKQISDSVGLQRKTHQLNFYSEYNIERLHSQFKQQLQHVYNLKAEYFMTKEKISTALELLAKFGSDNQKNSKTQYIKDIVLQYLESPYSELRKKAASIIFHFSSEKNPKFLQNLSLSNKIIQGIINKLLIISVNDSCDDVRHETLLTLNTMSKTFNQYLVTEENLKKLMLCFYDTNLEIRNDALLIFQKLAPYNPEIIPKIENLLFTLISFLSLKKKNFGQEEINHIKTLKLFIKKSPFFIEGKLLIICQIFFKLANLSYKERFLNPLENKDSENMIVAILSCMTEIMFLDGNYAVMFFSDIADFCVKIIENDDYNLINTAFKCLQSLIKYSGFQLVFVIKYDVQKLAFEKLQKNLSTKIKYEIFKFIGSLGAIDNYYVKKINKMREENKLLKNMSEKQIKSFIRKIVKKPLNVTKLINQKNTLIYDEQYKKFKSFKRNVRITENHQKNIEEINFFDIDITDSYKNSIKEHEEQLNSNITKIRYQREPPEVQIYSFDQLLSYICEHTFYLLFQLLDDNKDNEILMYILDSIELIIKHLAQDIYEFKEILFPELLRQFENQKDQIISKRILKNIKIFVLASSNKIANESNYLNYLLSILSKQFENQQYQKDIMEIILVLLEQPKCLLKHKIKEFIIHLLNILLVDPSNSNVKKIFRILNLLDNQDYMYHIMPVFSQILDNAINQNFQMSNTPSLKTIEQIYNYFTATLRCPTMLNYYSMIIRISIKILDEINKSEIFRENYQGLDKIVKKFLINMLLILKEKCLIHLPLMHDYLQYEEKYQVMLIKLRETGYFDVQLQPEFPERQLKNEYQEKENRYSFLKNSLRRINFETVIQIFDVSNNSKHDDWVDWFNKLKVDLIMDSPSNVLIACKELTCLEIVVKQLFKPAFAIIWSQLNDTQKSEIIRNFDIIISQPSKIPIMVLKEILELVEFMSHDNINGLSLDVSKLSFLATKCLSLPKAIYFKEKEYEYQPKQCEKSLRNLYIQSSFLGTTETLSEYEGKMINTKKQYDQDFFVKNPSGEYFEGFDNSELYQKDFQYSLKEQIKLNNAFSKWEFTIQKIKDYQENTHEINETKIEETIGIFGSKAAFHLSKWDKLQEYNKSNKDSFEKEFYNTCILIKNEKYENAKDKVQKLRQIFKREGITFGNYSGSYRKLLTLSKIIELEEIIKLKQWFNEIDNNELYKYMMTKEEIENKKKDMRSRMLQIWDDRLKLMEPNIRYWEETIGLRSLFCSMEELLGSYLQLAKLCLKKDRHQLYKQIFKTIQQNCSSLEDSDSILKLAFCEMEYQTGKIDEQGLISFVNHLLKDSDVDISKKQKFFKKVSKWLLNSENPSLDKGEVLDFVIKILYQSLLYENDDFKISHYYGLANFKAIKELNEIDKEKLHGYIEKAFQGFVRSVSMQSNQHKNFVTQDLLRILELWFRYGDIEKLQPCIKEAESKISQQDWLLVVGQIIARLDEKNETIRSSIKNLLMNLSSNYPQNLIFPLLIARRSKNKIRTRVAQKILLTIKNKYPQLFQEATTFSEELIRISVLLEEQWYNGINEAWKYVQENNYKMMKKVLDSLHFKTFKKNVKTINEIGFFQQFGTGLSKAKELMDLYFIHENEIFLTQAWNFYADFYRVIEKRFENFQSIYLENISESLLNFKNSKLLVPGEIKDKKIYIKKIHSVLYILKSKRKPRKLALFGTNNKKYFFLLKGNEDLRQDERVMQFLNLVNDLIRNRGNIDHNSLKIVTFNVLPLSVHTGLISWLDDSETLSQCIRNYREKFGIFYDCEKRLVEHYHYKYDNLSKMKKLEIYRYVARHTKAEDLKKILWLRNTSAETWLAQRTNYINSLAVMSMVGYILGLGDRHLSNLMLQRKTGKIVHIDFGDCFETASKREKLPEKVPFRLTRVLVNAMEAFGIKGTFKTTCENIMNLLRNNRESLIGILEEFVRDPLITWRMLVETKISDDRSKKNDSHKKTSDLKIIESLIDLKQVDSDQNHSFIVEGAVEMEIKQKNAQKKKNLNINVAISAIERIKKKLSGKEFDENQSKNFKEQVEELLLQATSQENISQAYSGWNPFLQSII